MEKQKEITCENCGAVYLAEEIPQVLQCTCKGKIFKIEQEAQQ